jgi:hypothetical protein
VVRSQEGRTKRYEDTGPWQSLKTPFMAYVPSRFLCNYPVCARENNPTSLPRSVLPFLEVFGVFATVYVACRCLNRWVVAVRPENS